MGISTLNSFFTKHHRIIFGVFAILIIIAFVFADWMGGGGGCSMFGGNPGDEQAAEVFGEKFSNRDLNDEARLVQLDNAIYFNGMRMTEEMLKQQAFERLTAKALAKRYNIVISDEDVAQGIFSMPLFIGKDNKFDKETYQKFIDNFLTQQGFTEADLNEVVRHRLLAQKIATVQGSVAPVSEAEVKAFYNTMYQQLDIRMALINIKDFESKVKVDDKALNEFFNSNRNLFTMPAELDAMVVEFAPAQYMAQVKIDEKEVKDYYEANKDFLTKVKDKDGKEVAPAFEAVKAEITQKLQEAAALKIAQDEAAKFSTEMYDLLNEQEAANRAVAFKTFAESKKFKVVTVSKVKANADKAGDFNSAELVQALAEIAIEQDLKLTEAVNAPATAYVGFVTGYTPQRQAEYNEAADQIKTQFIHAEATKLAQKRAAELAANFRKLPVAGREMRLQSKQSDFKALGVLTPADIFMQQAQMQQQAQLYMQLAQQGMIRQDMLQEQLDNMQQQLNMFQMLLTMPEGNVSEPQSIPGGFQILYMAKRQAPAQPFTASAELTSQCQMFKAGNSQVAFGVFTQAGSKLAQEEAVQEEQSAE